MPLEGQWRRAQTPLRQLTSRERRVAAGIAGAIVLALIVLIATTAWDTRPAPGPGCIRATIPHVMGAEQLNACGGRARHLCADREGLDDPGSKAIVESCRNAGI